MNDYRTIKITRREIRLTERKLEQQTETLELSDGTIVVNNDTRGVLFAGHVPSRRGKSTCRCWTSFYIPYSLIERVEVQAYNGASATCNKADILLVALDALNSLSSHARE